MDLSILLGRRLDDVVKHEYTWRFIFSGQAYLQAYGSWRLVVSEKLLITSEDHGHQFGLPAPVDCVAVLRREIIGGTVEEVKVRTGTIDITIDFGSGRTLEIITTSAGYEAWQLDAPGVLIVGNPGYEN